MTLGPMVTSRPTTVSHANHTVSGAISVALAESEARYRLLTENATDIIACYGAGGIFTFVSPSVTAVLGYTPEVLIGKSPVTFIHPDDMKSVRSQFAAHMAQGSPTAPLRFEYRAFRRDMFAGNYANSCKTCSFLVDNPHFEKRHEVRASARPETVRMNP